MKCPILLLVLSMSFAVLTFADEPVSRDRLQEEFLQWKFGMFLHFNIATFNEREWGNGYEDPATFAPEKLDCNQWAEVANAAGMKYAVLTAKHTGGWCLWDSQCTKTHDMTMFKNYKHGKGDIVREFVDAFRRRGLKVGLYYCFPGDYAGNHGAPQPPEGKQDLVGLPSEAEGDYVGFIKKQLTELLTQYGKIDLLWIDQYGNHYTQDSWQAIMQHVKSLQADCIIVANNSRDYKDTDILSYEYPYYMGVNKPEMALPPEDNKDPAEVCDKLGPEWFWKSYEDETNVKPAIEVVTTLKKCNSRRANYLLNVAPDSSGLIPAVSLMRLREVGDLLSGKTSLPSDRSGKAEIEVE